MRYRPVAAIAALVFCAGTAVGAAASSQAWWQKEYWAYFTFPRVDHASGKIIGSRTIHNVLLAFINAATPYSEIRGHISKIGCNHRDVADALIAAHRRGVTVYLVHDGGELKNGHRVCTTAGQPAPSPGQVLEAYFRTRHKWCYQPMPLFDAYDLTSCVSSYFGADTTHHIKNWMFEETVINGVIRRWSSLVTSYNLARDSEESFNDLFVVNNDWLLYNAFIRSFASFYNQQRTTDFYHVPGRGHHVLPGAGAEISYSPQASGDQVATALSRIDASSRGCRLQAAIYTFSRSRIVDELVRIRQELKCVVQVVVGSEVGSSVSARLLDAGVELRFALTPLVHSKMMLYKGHYDGTPGHTLVWGGSHNWTGKSLRVRDEVFVALENARLYRQYGLYFLTLWNGASPA